MVSDVMLVYIAFLAGFVLILVLMEYGLWPDTLLLENKHRICLNPCSNGIWSLTWSMCPPERRLFCLNPCSNGIWSLTLTTTKTLLPSFRLNPCSNGIWSLAWGKRGRGNHDTSSLNPCSNGIWSLTKNCYTSSKLTSPVLILVLMEYGLWLVSWSILIHV